MVLETERLVLKPYEVEFADAIFEVVKHKKIADTMVMIPHPYPREVVDQWISYLQKSFAQVGHVMGRSPQTGIFKGRCV